MYENDKIYVLICFSFFEKGLYKPTWILYNNPCAKTRGISSVGRVPHWQCGCQEFESPMLHHRSTQSLIQRLGAFLCLYSRQKALMLRYFVGFFNFPSLAGCNKNCVSQAQKSVFPCTRQTGTHRVFTQQTGTKSKCTQGVHSANGSDSRLPESHTGSMFMQILIQKIKALSWA